MTTRSSRRTLVTDISQTAADFEKLLLIKLHSHEVQRFSKVAEPLKRVYISNECGCSSFTHADTWKRSKQKLWVSSGVRRLDLVRSSVASIQSASRLRELYFNWLLHLICESRDCEEPCGDLLTFGLTLFSFHWGAYSTVYAFQLDLTRCWCIVNKMPPSVKFLFLAFMHCIVGGRFTTLTCPC